MAKGKNNQLQVINYALVAKTHTPMYLMHKYWARKPHNVVSEYIKHHSREGEIVLDPFGGSGVTAAEALKLGRKAASIDLDPMSTFITRSTILPVDLKQFRDTFEQIGKKIKNKINALYVTKCGKCAAEAIIEATVWKDEKPIEIRYNCATHGSNWKKITSADLEKIKETEKKEVPYWYPTNELIENSRVNVHAGEKVSDLFTKRNIIALSIILHEIEEVKDKDIRELLEFTFTSSLATASKIVPYQQRFKTGGAGWKIRGFWVANERFEMNAWSAFERRFEKVLRGKEESNSLIKRVSEGKDFEALRKKANLFVKTHNALELDKIIPENSVDYIFTDPPYGDSVPYLELDYMWSSWMGFKPDFEDEIIVSDSPVRNKTEDVYERMMKVAFIQIYRVLKPGRYMTVTFHNTEIKIWNDIINACTYAGFNLEKIIYQPPAHVSSKARLAPYGSAIGDYYIRFKKPETKGPKDVENFDEERYERIVAEAAKKIIAERGEPTPYAFILNGIIVELKKEGALLSGKRNPDEVMKSLLNKEFILVDAKDEKGKIIGKKWWFKDPSSVPYLELVPLMDRVETAIVDTLRRKVKVSFDDVLQEIFIKFPNALTPETQDIKALLSEYAMPTKDGNWTLKSQVKERISEHSEMIYYLAQLGAKAGFDVWVGTREQHEIYNGQKLSQLITNRNPVWRFIPTTSQERVKQIDVIWHDEGRVKYEFEVENTTAITEAIVRGSNVPHNEIVRTIVIPEEREALLFRKMKEPIFNEQVGKFGWKFMFYKDVKKAFEENERAKKIDAQKVFEKLFKQPKEARSRQASLGKYVV